MNPLQTIQSKLKANKSQFNKFGNYHYRNQEDILEAVKPLLTETNSFLTLSDDLVEVGGALFVKATAEFSWGESTEGRLTIRTTAYAKHAVEQKGMSDSQITGSTSSYARKYALNGLFLIDDAKDDDSKEQPEEKKKKTTPSEKNPGGPSTTPKEQPWLNPATGNWTAVLKRMKESKSTPSPVTIETIKKNFRLSTENEKLLINEANS